MDWSPDRSRVMSFRKTKTSNVTAYMSRCFADVYMHAEQVFLKVKPVISHILRRLWNNYMFLRASETLEASNSDGRGGIRKVKWSFPCVLRRTKFITLSTDESANNI
jgi:hypothetical protein